MILHKSVQTHAARCPQIPSLANNWKLLISWRLLTVEYKSRSKNSGRVQLIRSIMAMTHWFTNEKGPDRILKSSSGCPCCRTRPSNKGRLLKSHPRVLTCFFDLFNKETEKKITAWNILLSHVLKISQNFWKRFFFPVWKTRGTLSRRAEQKLPCRQTVDVADSHTCRIAAFYHSACLDVGWCNF